MRRRRSDAGRRRAATGVVAGVTALLLAPVGASAQDTNESGAQALLLPMGARVVGVGGGAVAARYGGETVLANPAALGFATAREIALQHGQDVFGRRDLLTVVVPSRRAGTFAVSGYLVDYGQQTLTDENNVEIGTTYPRNVALTVSYASTVRRALSLGLTYRLYQFRNDCSGLGCDAADQEALAGTTSMIDLGAQYDFGKRAPLVLGASLRYLGLRLQVRDSDQKDPLPTQLDVGARYEVAAVAERVKDTRLSVSGDVVRGVSAGGSDMAYHVGAEASFRERVQLRGGWMQQKGDGNSGPTVGFGFQAKRWGLDVARQLAGVSVDVGEPPTYVSLRYNF